MWYLTGQPIDGPHNGPAPGPWDIVSQPCDLFQDEIRTMEIPHTASVMVRNHAKQNPCYDFFFMLNVVSKAVIKILNRKLI